MVDGLNFNLTRLTQDCFSEFSACSIVLPITFISTIAAILATYLSIFVGCAKPNTALFGLTYPIGVLQGFLLVRYSQGQSSYDVLDNDAALFFVGIFVMVGSAVAFMVDFIQSLGMDERINVVIKLCASVAVCGCTILIMLFPLQNLHDMIGLGSFLCMGMLVIFHFALSIIGICKTDKQVFPIIYSILYTVCFGCWAGTVVSHNEGMNDVVDDIEILMVFSSCFVIEFVSIILNLCTKLQKRERLGSAASFGQNIRLFGDSKHTEE